MNATFPETFEIDGKLGPIRGDVYRNTEAANGVIICHGFKGFARWGFFPHVGRKLAAARLNAIAFDFSGSGIGPDRESSTEEERFARNTFSAELDDLGRVIDHAKSEKLIGEEYGLFGHSRGGGVAILRAGSDRHVAALVTWAAISKVDRWNEKEAAQWKRDGFTEIANSRTGQVLKLGTDLLEDVRKNVDGSLDIEAAAAKITAPWLILHGSSDETVDQEEAKRLHEASAHSKLRVIAGGHGFEGKHPLAEVPPPLEEATTETVLFFSANLGA